MTQNNQRHVTAIFIKKKREKHISSLFLCDSCRIQTCNLLIRSQMLYSVELRSHLLFSRSLSLKSDCKDTKFFQMHQIFFDILLKLFRMILSMCHLQNTFFIICTCSKDDIYRLRRIKYHEFHQIRRHQVRILT